MIANLRLPIEGKTASLLSLHVCDVVNLHLFAAETFAFIHSHQSAEHWKPEWEGRQHDDGTLKWIKVQRPGPPCETPVLQYIADLTEMRRRVTRDLNVRIVKVAIRFPGGRGHGWPPACSRRPSWRSGPAGR